MSFPERYHARVNEPATEWGISHSFTDSVRWPDPKRGPWRVQCTWSNVGGYARLTYISIESLVIQKGRSLTVEPITASVYRSLAPGAVADQVLQKIKESPDFDLGADDDDLVVGRRARGGRTGRPPSAADKLAEAAAIYKSHMQSGGTTPTKAVSDELHISRSAAAKRVARARAPEAGLLDPTTQGKKAPVVKGVSKGSVVKRTVK